jgi:hypothetical protein
MDGTRPAAALAMAIGLLACAGGAAAQTRTDNFVPPVVGKEAAESASPAGAVYIPGVGFRYVVPGSRVYGWTGYGPRVYGYRARTERKACGDWWGFERCRRWR